MHQRSWSFAVVGLALTVSAALPTRAFGLQEGGAASSRPTYRVERASGAIQVDGVLDEAAWQGPPTFTLDFETQPGENTPPAERTELWIRSDERAIYVAARAYDAHPEQIRAHLTDRDRAFQDDFVGVVLDTFNDERRASEFFVNPLGVQMDLSQNDVTGNEDDTWDAIWDSAGRLTAAGYEVELAIPFSSLRFPRTQGPQTWGIDAVRAFPRGQRYRFGLNSQPRGKNCYLCNESKLIGFEGASPGRNLELDPTLTAHAVDSRDALDGPFRRETKIDPGISARWGVTPGMTLNATINPDFSQVEADSPQLSVNTQFALFYPEKRPFFLEGADLFETKINAVYSREISDPSWGLKVTGKEGSSAFGAFVARDQRTNLLLPGSQFSNLASLDQANVSSIVRYRRDIAGSGSALGGLFTSREGEGYHNRVAGVDGLWRWAGTEAARLEVLTSNTAYPQAIRGAYDQPAGDFTGTAWRFAYQHQSRAWKGTVLYSGAGENFRADLGFIPQVGYRSGFGLVEKYFYADHGEHWWHRFTVGSESTWTVDARGNPLQRQIAPYVNFGGPRQSNFNIYLGLGPSYYQGRRFDRTFLHFYSEAQLTGTLFTSLEGHIGQEIDYANARQGNIVRFGPNVRLDLGRHWRLQAQHNYETLRERGGRLYTANLTDLRATYQFNVRTFLRLVAQYFDLDQNTELYGPGSARRQASLHDQLLFSYKVNPQTVLFVGYSDGYRENLRLDLKPTDRTLFFKVGYAFVS